MPEPIRYRDDLEVEVDGETDLVDETIATMRHTMEQAFEQHRHATSGTHAKSHGVATGRLTVPGDLPPELAQGLFATAGSYEAVVRYASEPGQLDADTRKRARGLALKVLDVHGETMRPEWTSQDLLFNTWPVIPEGDVGAYLDAIRARDEHAGHHLRTVATSLARNRDPQGTLFDRTPNLHPVAHRYYSQAAFRYGDHVAKFAAIPVAAEQLALAEDEVARDASPAVLRDLVREYFAAHAARYELRVQLCTDLDAMPIEDASVEWPEDVSPYRTVATLDLPRQETFSPARRVYAEDVMSWRPWYGLAAHRPLGSINRVRRRAYEVLGAWRHDMNAVPERDPVSLADVPD